MMMLLLSNRRLSILRDRLARMLQGETSRIEMDAEVLEAHLSFSANIILDETNKDKKEKKKSLIKKKSPSGNDTIWIDYDKKTNTYKVRQETSDKDVEFLSQRPLHSRKRLSRRSKARTEVRDIVYPGRKNRNKRTGQKTLVEIHQMER